MSNRNSRIPLDPIKNLERLRSIRTHYKQKLERINQDIPLAREKVTRLAEAMEKDDGSDADEAARRKLIHGRFVYDLNQLLKAKRTIKGKLHFNQHQIGYMETVVSSKSALTHKPFESLSDSE